MTSSLLHVRGQSDLFMSVHQTVLFRNTKSVNVDSVLLLIYLYDNKSLLPNIFNTFKDIFYVKSENKSYAKYRGGFTGGLHI